MQNLNNALRKASKRIVDRLKHEATRTRKIKRNDGSVYSGRLDTDGDIKGSLKVSIRGSRITISANKEADFWDKGVDGTRHKVKGKTPYKRKSAPPTEALKEWAKKKGIDEKAVYPIGQKIKERGTPQTGFITDTVDELLLKDKKINDLIMDGLSKDIDEALDEALDI